MCKYSMVVIFMNLVNAVDEKTIDVALVLFQWFISNYLYRLSLLYTTTGSATIYTSTAGALALSFGAIFAQVPHDRFTLSKCIAVLLTAAGLVSFMFIFLNSKFKNKKLFMV